ncbi:glycosyltransferase family 9 protein [Thiobacter aerophilum]|uniref:Glycosyltransferase family 9 protein n=1 Tax=Thiobacter aerophilum TaxID=3121275 RepID=A0ABV0EG26_9BURK
MDELFPFDNRWAGFFAAAKRLRGYDLAVILHGNEPQATPLAYLSGARYIFKLPNDNEWNFLLTNQTPRLGWQEMGHGLDQRLEVVRLAGAPGPFDRRMIVPRHEDGERLVEERLQRLGWQHARLVALQPGASTNSRRWPAGRFVEAAQRLLVANGALKFVITGSPRERELCMRIAEAINASSATKRLLAWVSAGDLPLRALPALLNRAQVLITGDTGPMHLAVAVGTPVVALFAVSNPARSGPAYDLGRHVVIRKWRTCDPCLSKRCPYAEPLCMNNIQVDEVVTATQQVLRQHDSPN